MFSMHTVYNNRYKYSPYITCSPIQGKSIERVKVISYFFVKVD